MTKEELKAAISEIQKGSELSADKLRSILLSIMTCIEELEKKTTHL